MFEVESDSNNPSLKLSNRGFSVSFVHTPGHSPGSACIFIEDCVFTGDTILNEAKTPLGFPHSSRRDYAASMVKLEQLLTPGMIIYPGHGSPFKFSSY